MRNLSFIILSGLLLNPLASQTVFTWDGGSSTDRFGNEGNWDPNGVPGAGDTGTIDSQLVTIGTAGEMQTGATININGSSTLQRNSISYSGFSGALNINDQTDVQISEWRPLDNATLNWSSTGTFSIAPAGPQGRRFYIDDGNTNDNTVVNMSAGTWDLTGNPHQDSFAQEAGTFNMTGGLMITDKRFKIGTTGGGGTFNYGVNAEIRAASMGLFADAIFNMDPGSTIFLDAGLLGGMGGQDGADYWRDELRLGEGGSNIYIDGEQQTLGSDETLVDSNFSHTQLQIDGDWYDSITAVPEPETYAVIFGVLAMGIVVYRRKR